MDSAIDGSTSASDPTNTPSKSRSFSDPASAQGSLAPSPSFHERQRESKDDSHATPTTPRVMSRRPDFLCRGLSLQMPSRTEDMLSPAHFPRPAPLSPQLDQRDIYMQSRQENLSASPATSIPRHSRGLDFSRASTTLHHSTTAEQSSPDSSPVITQKGMMIPLRKGSVSSMMLDSPALNGVGSVPWGSSLAPERSTVSSSVGSINMLASESESSDSDGDASMGGDDPEDPILTTPQVHKLQNPAAATPFTGPQTPGGGAPWGAGSHFSPAQASLMRTIRRTKVGKNGRRSRKSSSSASGSGYSSLASPRTASPPPMRSIESAATNGSMSGGYFAWAANAAAKSRRESLALGTDGLHLSSGNDSGDEATLTPGTPGVVRRPVTRRGNLLPKTKGFARIRAALLEEAAPVDTEIRRESETIRQVRERDHDTLTDLHDRPGTAASSPNLLPAVPESAQEDFGHDLEGESGKGLGMNFAAHATRHGGGLDYWNRFDPSMRTPPPPPSFARQGSSVMSDMNMDSPANLDTQSLWRRPRARSSASDASEALMPTSSSNSNGLATGGANGGQAGMNDDVHLKKFKRRREDDFDIATIKRRAVSPGMSAQNSPVLTQSPSARDAGGGSQWGGPPEKKTSGSSKEQTQPPSSAGSDQAGKSGNGNVLGGSCSVGGLATQGRKLGLQGMVDTNDGLMKMSIE